MLSTIFKTRLLVVASLVLALIGIYGFIAYRAGARNVDQYESVVTGTKRSLEDKRGLINNMMKFRKDFVPAFLPQHLWDEEYCAGALVTAVNFMTGQKTLVDASSWEFSRKNKANLTPVYGRPPEDFKWTTSTDGTHHLTEVYDRPIWLSKILPMANGTTDRLYVVGYHYSQTRSDEKVWEAKADLNTHVMLLLGRYDGSWYGYHMLHDMKDDTTYPFKIESLSDDMSKWFDIIYIWEVRDTELATGEGSRIAFAQDLSAYDTIKTVNMLPGLGKANVAFFGDIDQFPHIVRETNGVYPIVHRRDSYAPGTVLGFVGGAAIKYHNGRTEEKDRTEYGLRGQCVEFANRYLVLEQKHKNLTRTGHAIAYFYDAAAKGLTAYRNGGTEKPAVGDLMIFGQAADGPGHVAVVTAVKSDSVCIAQQNGHPWNLCLSMTQSRDGTWLVGQFNETLTCRGWSRVSQTKPAAPEAVTPPAPQTVATPAPAQPKPAKPAPPSTYVIKVQKVKRGLRHTVRAVVHRTAKADLQATFACNSWDFSQEARHKIYPGQTWKVCAWKK